MTTDELRRRAQVLEQRVSLYWDLRCRATGDERRAYHAWFVREHEAWGRALERVSRRVA